MTMTIDRKSIQNDKSFKKFIERDLTRSKNTVTNYEIATLHFCRSNNSEFHSLVKKVFHEQRAKIVGNEIIPYDPDYALIDTLQYNMLTYLQNKGLKNTSITVHILNIRTVLSNLKIQLPAMPNLPDDAEAWYVLTKQEIRYLMLISSPTYSNLIEFQASTGIRIGDIVNFTIEDFMIATYEYHECDTLEEFLKKAPKGMIAYWEFIPEKTKRYKQPCKVPSTPILSDKLLRNLHERSKFLKKKGLILEKTDALFGNRRLNYKGHIKSTSVPKRYRELNALLVSERLRVLNQKLENNEISKDKYKKLLEEPPKFHSHALRKYFISTLAKNHVHIRDSAIMEGHAPPLKNDPSYISPTKESIIAEYNRAIDDFNFDDVKVDFTITRRNEELEKENKRLTEEIENINKNIEGEVAKQIRNIMKNSWEKTKKNL